MSRVVFKDGILGGTRQFWSNPYLNSTTILFDIYNILSLNLFINSSYCMMFNIAELSKLAELCA